MIQPLFAETERTTPPLSFRPIHYLGSKLRLIEAVESAIQQVQPTGTLCDLLAGSGTVALAMSQHRPLITVDIQEYSRLICSALLAAPEESAQIGKRAGDRARNSALLELLDLALRPMIEYEKQCVERAEYGDPVGLCDFIEQGALSWFIKTGAPSASDALRVALQSAVDNLTAHGLMCAPGSVVTRHFAGAYFSYRQAIALDALLEAAHTVSPELRDAAVAPVLSTASDVVNTIGKHFAQPLRPRYPNGTPKNNLVQRVMKDRIRDVLSIHESFVGRYAGAARLAEAHQAIRADFADFLSTFTGNVAVFYADPPYTRDHYSRFYHALETMALRDDPEMSTSLIRNGKIPRLSRGFYRQDRHQSPFCIKSQAPGAFEQMFQGVRNFDAPLVLSYSPFEKESGARPRLMSVEQIATIARRSFRNVTVTLAGDFAHSKLNAQEYNAPISRNAEVLIICEP